MNLHSDVSLIDNQIIPAKISLPYQQRGIIQRKQLHNLLEGSFSHRLTLVCAPAGYGKTTLVSDWVANQSAPVAWLSLTQEDNQVPVFLAYLSAALKKVHPGFGDCIEEVLHQNRDIHFPSLGRSLLQEMDQVTPGMLLVLDDFHIIHNPQIHELIQFVLQNCSCWTQAEGTDQGVHVILISRTDPPFPLSKWRLHQELIEIGIDELKFSLAETEEFIKKVNQPEMKSDKIQQIAAHTEGWVTGLQLTLLSMKSTTHPHPDHPQLHANNTLLVDYLLEEVIQDLPEEIQQFLLQTSILEYMTADLCDQIRCQTDSQQILEWLAHNNLFILPMDNQQGWYRYHQFFLDVLVQRQYLLDKEILNEYHRRAARWLEGKGYIQDSLHHWLVSGNTQEATRMLVKNAPHLMNRYQGPLLKQLIDLLPETCFSQNPWICIYRAWSLSITSENSMIYWINKAVEWIETENCKGIYSEDEIQEMLGNIFTIRARFESRLGDDEKTASYANQALKLLPDRAMIVRELALSTIAEVYFRTGDLDQALNILLQSRMNLQESGNLSSTSRVIFQIGRIYHLKGKLKTAYRNFQDAVSILESQPVGEITPSYAAYSGLALIELEWNQLDLAYGHIQKSNAKRDNLGINKSALSCLAYLEYYSKLNKLGETRKITNEAEQYIADPSLYAYTRSELIGALIKYYSLTHHHQFAQHIIDEFQVECLKPGDVQRESELIGLGYFYWMTCTWDQLKELCEKLIPILESSGRIDRLIQIETLYAIALYQFNDIQNAVHYLTEALNQGSKEGYFQTYSCFGKPIIDLINAGLKSNMLSLFENHDLAKLQEISTAISQRIVEGKFQKKTIKRIPIHIPNTKNLLEPLTTKESELLKFLASERDYKTIAKEMRLSITTIKTHVYHIYNKLGVRSRMEAVIKAKELDLL